jgi:hypothetical protein
VVAASLQGRIDGARGQQRGELVPEGFQQP